jgi:hypothetical protein
MARALEFYGSGGRGLEDVNFIREGTVGKALY